MKNIFPAALLGLALLLGTATAQDTTTTTRPKVNMIDGPATAKLGTIAEIDVPVGYTFMDGETTRTMMKAMGQPTSGHELGALSPTNADWSVMFEFDESGYVKDDEKDKLDADKILKSIIKGNDSANEDRKRMGSDPIEVVGWDMPPKYDETTHNLEWAVRGRSRGHDFLNHNTRLLGRKGVMEVVLIVDPEEYAATMPEYRKLLGDYKYQSGQTYAEYRPGDKVAKYGLAALVLGGAAVGAAKLGLLGSLALLFKKGFKLIIVAVVAVGVFFKKIFNKLTGRGNDDSMS